MTKQQKSTATKGRVFLSKCKNRPYLAACPAHILSAEFFLDLKLQKKVMKLRIQNTSDRAVTGMTILARYLDKNGGVMGDPEGFIILKFANIYCAPGKTALGSKTVILPYQDIAGLAAYVTSVCFDDGREIHFRPGDYTLSPPQDMLENHLSPADFNVLRTTFGDRCFFVPAPYGREHFLCACGAVLPGEESAVCPACGMKHADAVRLCSDASRAAFIRALKHRRSFFRILPYAVGTVLIAAAIAGVGMLSRTYIVETLPSRRLAYTQRYMEEHRYAEALGYSVTKNHSLMYDEILDHAVAYYCSEGDYASAMQYEKCRTEPDYAPIYTHAANALLHGDADAVEYALLTEDETLKNDVLSRMARKAYDDGDPAAACAIALHMTGKEGTTFADGLLYEVIEDLLESGAYDSAVTYINCLTDKSGVTQLCRGIEMELLTLGKFEDAFTVASITGDQSVFAMAYHSASATTMRAYIDKFFPYMTADEKRAFLAENLSVGGAIAAINSDGTAMHSTDGPLCDRAISVAAGTDHTVVLTENGTVKTFGDNTYGQCDPEGIEHVIAVAAGARHTVLLLEDGTVRAFGDNSHGQCSVTEWKDVIAVTAGEHHTAALLADGTAVAVGSNQSGQCSVTGYRDVIAVEAGDYATALIFRDGTVAVEGNITLETYDCRDWQDIVEVKIGNAHMIGLTAVGRVLFAGDPPYEGAAGVADWSRVRTIACGKTASYGISATGDLMTGDPSVTLPAGEGWEVLKG